MANYLVDLKYSNSSRDWTTDTSNDIAIVGGNEAIAQACILRLIIPRGQYMFNPDLGSDLYLILKEKVTDAIEAKAKSAIEQALQPEIDSGNLESVNRVIVKVNKDDNTRIDIRVSATIRGEQIDIGVTI